MLLINNRDSGPVRCHDSPCLYPEFAINHSEFPNTAPVMEREGGNSDCVLSYFVTVTSTSHCHKYKLFLDILEGLLGKHLKQLLGVFVTHNLFLFLDKNRHSLRFSNFLMPQI